MSFNLSVTAQELNAAVAKANAAAPQSTTYTKAETNALLTGKADLENGKIPMSQMPPAAIEREVVVSDDTARFALTTSEVQLGDTVKVTATNKMYLVKDTAHLDSESGYDVYVAGRAAEAVGDQNGNTIDTTYATIASVSDVLSHISFDSSSKHYYLQQTQPANPQDGDIWIG